MSNPVISSDTSKVLTVGNHFKWSEPANLTIIQKYLVYTTSNKIDTFHQPFKFINRIYSYHIITKFELLDLCHFVYYYIYVIP